MYHKFAKAKDPMSSYTHFLGAIASGIVTIILIFQAQNSDFYSKTLLWSVVLFGVSLVLLYTASTIYHYCTVSPAVSARLRKLDHAMIYVLIAGTYTPIAARYLENPAIFLSIIWTATVLGIAIKLLWLDAPRVLSTALYLILGWSLLFDWSGFARMPAGCLTLIALGGVSYSIGAVIYMLKKPNIGNIFGFHEIFHLFILLGSCLHVIAVMQYIV